MKPLNLARGALLGVLVGACMPQQLVLRRASVDWESIGIRSVAVVPVPPPAKASMVTSNSSPSPVVPPATADEGAVGYGEADLEPATRDAAELLTFALRQSAVDVVGTEWEPARVELTVKEIKVEKEKRTERELAAALRQSTLLSIRDDPGYLRASRIVKATVFAKLVQPGSSRPLWFKEAIGSVDLGLSRSAAASAGDPFPPLGRSDRSGEEEVLRFYREIAVRRALKQIADDLLPHYEYVEVK